MRTDLDEARSERVEDSRPVIPLFATLAAWDDGAEGLVGGIDYAGEQFGASWGLQVEAWC